MSYNTIDGSKPPGVVDRFKFEQGFRLKVLVGVIYPLALAVIATATVYAYKFSFSDWTFESPKACIAGILFRSSITAITTFGSVSMLAGYITAFELAGCGVKADTCGNSANDRISSYRSDKGRF